MRLFFSKFGFIHRRLWNREGYYRIAVLFGPAPLAGAAMAAIVWASIGAVKTGTGQPPPWAHYTRETTEDNGSPDAPLPATPARPLPPLRADGSAIGYDSGWNMTANPLTIGAVMNTDIGATPIMGFTLDEPTITMARILEAGPKDRLFAALASGLLVIREAGTYGIFPRFERPAGPLGNCVVRMGVGSHRVTSGARVDLAQHVKHDDPPAWFRFQPGLYWIEWAFGCWSGNKMNDLGQISVMLITPGDHTVRSLRAIDIVR